MFPFFLINRQVQVGTLLKVLYSKLFQQFALAPVFSLYTFAYTPDMHFGIDSSNKILS